jgi:hypothetical protein
MRRATRCAHWPNAAANSTRKCACTPSCPRHRLKRGGHRQANTASHRILIVHMRFHEPTINYVTRRTEDGRTKREIMRCLKRALIREIYQYS